MKKVLWLSLLTVVVSTFSFNAFAEWQCYVKDKGGHQWRSEGSTQDRATTVAMSFCNAFSPDSKTCEFNKCIGN